MAEETWWSTYSPILSIEQIRYMLDALYSAEALQKAMESGSQTFIILHDGLGCQGFAAYGPKPETPHIAKLHKIYVLPQNHGKGYGKMLIDEVKKKVTALNMHTLELNVNRYNNAKSFYEKIGFRVIGEEDVPIGPYLMNDYIMRLEFNP
jgi:diamine N-acetyltransferase